MEAFPPLPPMPPGMSRISLEGNYGPQLEYTYKGTSSTIVLPLWDGGKLGFYKVQGLSLVTAPPQRGKGQAVTVMKQTLRDLHALQCPLWFGFHAAPLDNYTSQERLIAFYTKMGFHRAPRRDEPELGYKD